MSPTITLTYSLTNHEFIEKTKKNYNENLMEKLVSVAENELRENTETREQCLESFRDWIKKNQDISNCILDDSFLLRFLRVKKFSLPMAQQTLLKYLNFRNRFSYITRKLDYKDSKVLELINNGYIFVCPSRDKQGRRVIVTNLRKLDPYKYTNVDMARAHIVTYETLIDDEENQILGITHVGDGDGVSSVYIGLWSISEFATIIKWGEHSYPIRHKACHIINVPSAVKHVVDFACTRVSDKLKNRLHIHNSKEELHKYIPSDILPKEYGGIMASSVMIELWKKEMDVKRKRLLSYDKISLLSDKGIITSRNGNRQNFEDLQGSFRKLNVD